MIKNFESNTLDTIPIHFSPLCHYTHLQSGIISNTIYLFNQTENRIRDYLTIPKIKIKNGEIQIPTNPGLGVDVDERFLYDFSGSDEIDIKKVVG